MSIQEALLSAEQSSDLSEIADGVSDVDFLRAAGMVAQRHGLALSVWRLCELGDRTLLHSVFDGLYALLLKQGVRYNPAETISNVLSWMAKPTCPTCEGRGFERVPGTPHLSERACPDCHGTGRRAPHWNDDEARLADWIVTEQHEAARLIASKMRG